jgi:DHA2 family multidrug resistance protein-like MFS transporter
MGVFAVLAAMALVVFDTGIANIALPSISARFHATGADTVLIVSVYQIAVVAMLLPCAHVASRIGLRRLFALGIAAFCAGAVACTFAPTFGLLVAARCVQGTGAAAIMALGIALLRATLGEQRLADAVAWNALIVALCSAIGPLVGGLLVAWAPLSWLFVASVPIGLAALFASRALPESAPHRHEIRSASIVLYIGGVALLFVAARAANGSAGMIACAAVACLALLVARERNAAAPIIPLDLLRLPRFRGAILASICCFTGQSLGLIALPFLIQDALGRGPLAAGGVIFCWPTAVAITSRLAHRVGWEADNSLQSAIGAIVLGSGLVLCSAGAGFDAVMVLVVGSALCGVGFGLVQLANNRAMFGAVPAERAATAGGLQGTGRVIGQALGSTLMATLLASHTSSYAATQTGLAVGAAFALLSALASGATWASNLVRWSPIRFR